MFISRISLACLLLTSFSANVRAEPDEAAYPALKRFVEVLETARERHPDLDKIAYDRLINQALDGMLSSLDPHSSFIHPEMQPFMDDSGNLNNEVPSLGLSLGKDSEGIFISAIEKHGPADKAGIIAGTEIISVNSVPQDTLESTEVVNLFAGPAGSQITLTLRNPERPGELEVTLTRRFVEGRSLIKAVLLEKHPETGYLRLATFGANCAREIEAALDDLEDKGMKHLILDLRENGGGDLHETVSILGLFVPPSTKVVSVRARDEPEEFLETPDRQRRKRDYPIVVLIDRNSASASELSAGSLSDLKRATIIGEKSYGKGSVQNIVPMGGGTALRLTIATYHTPSGNTPHLKGITPDVKIDFSEKDREFFLQAGRPSSLTEAETKSLAAWEDPAIAAAIAEFAK
ncbi:MAG: S41 family peptidase [Akkermansiaceae bacterium]|nr:S41 family peptidase [Akkermansiaceae bacterium]MDP4647134.1 S41 family peptidase [Akkermansiaceae bacterium]MDP4722604.1 S41 family peptidase [Akkermansiaceae bacterium]MDP4780428.1 S41 family peptidase [Akkermansiaceae bacterium]MDP4847745.1 S41 family peptidase [Akkermansiaceae bacterium]